MTLRSLVALCVILNAAPLSEAGERKVWRRVSAAAACAAHFADAYSSRGRREGNPLLARSNGSIHWGIAIPVKAGLCGLSLFLAESSTPASFVIPLNLGIAGVTGGVAIRNFKIQPRVSPATPMAK